MLISSKRDKRKDLRARGAAVALAAAFVSLVAFAPAAPAATFTNPAPITTSAVIAGSGTPYPSTIQVNGVAGTVSDVNVTLSGLTTNGLSAQELALVAPNGTAVEFMRRVGGLVSVAGVNYTVDDSAGGQFPNTGALPSGGYKPTFQPTTPPPTTPVNPFTAPCPAATLLNPGPAPGGTPGTLASFNGLDPNGTWSLCMRNTLDGSSATVAGGWSIDVTGGATGQRDAALKKCKKKKSHRAKKKCKKKAKKLPL